MTFVIQIVLVNRVNEKALFKLAKNWDYTFYSFTYIAVVLYSILYTVFIYKNEYMYVCVYV